MIKFDKNEFLKPQIYSTLDEYESRCNVTKEIIEEIEQLQQENEQLKEELKYTVPIVEHNKIVNKKLKENQKYKEVIDKAIEWVRDWTDDKNDWFEEDSKPSELLDILKEVK